MRKSNKIIAGVLCSVLVAGSVFGLVKNKISTQADETFVPVFRMAVCSDPHVTPENSTLQKKLDNFFKSAYKYSDNHEEYTSLDAIVITGDLTHEGKAIQYANFKQTVADNLRKETEFISMLGNHDVMGPSSGVSDNYYETGENAYKMLIDQDLDKHVTVKGFHLISMSNSTYMGKFKQVEWLKTQLAEAAKDDSSKPIFTFQHFHISNTIYGSKTGFHSAENSSEIDAAYKQYSQVINFSGHSHGPALNTRGVYQKDYTVFDVSTFKDIGLGFDDHILYNTYWNGYTNPAFDAYPNDATDQAKTNTQQAADVTNMFKIVEVDKNNVVRVYTYDMYTNSLAKTPASTDGDALLVYEIDVSKGKDGFTYTDEKYADITAPFWNNGASVTATRNEDGSIVLKFPQAGEDDCMYDYTVTASATGKNDVVFKLADAYFSQNNTADESFTLKGLESGVAYTFKVTATNVWGKESSPITGSIAA